MPHWRWLLGQLLWHSHINGNGVCPTGGDCLDNYCDTLISTATGCAPLAVIAWTTTLTLSYQRQRGVPHWRWLLGQLLWHSHINGNGVCPTGGDCLDNYSDTLISTATGCAPLAVIAWTITLTLSYQRQRGVPHWRWLLGQLLWHSHINGNGVCPTGGDCLDNYSDTLISTATGCAPLAVIAWTTTLTLSYQRQRGVPHWRWLLGQLLWHSHINGNGVCPTGGDCLDNYSDTLISTATGCAPLAVIAWTTTLTLSYQRQRGVPHWRWLLGQLLWHSHINGNGVCPTGGDCLDNYSDTLISTATGCAPLAVIAWTITLTLSYQRQRGVPHWRWLLGQLLWHSHINGNGVCPTGGDCLDNYSDTLISTATGCAPLAVIVWTTTLTLYHIIVNAFKIA